MLLTDFPAFGISYYIGSSNYAAAVAFLMQVSPVTPPMLISIVQIQLFLYLSVKSLMAILW